jgi:hypothetical protein
MGMTISGASSKRCLICACNQAKGTHLLLTFCLIIKSGLDFEAFFMAVAIFLAVRKSILSTSMLIKLSG